jgi:hypothetical protein
MLSHLIKFKLARIQLRFVQNIDKINKKLKILYINLIFKLREGYKVQFVYSASSKQKHSSVKKGTKYVMSYWSSESQICALLWHGQH